MAKFQGIFINGNLTAALYQHEVLDTEVILLLRNHRGMQLLHDGSPVHRTRATTAYLNADDVNVVDPPPPNHQTGSGVVLDCVDS